MRLHLGIEKGEARDAVLFTESGPYSKDNGEKWKGLSRGPTQRYLQNLPGFSMWSLYGQVGGLKIGQGKRNEVVG